uniref:Aromatic amino acid beta-eliminating lyase/threonine aldolase domain-containing protein n=2 Tax=Arion vulgaris TaxID=1028688 RepID=A0A0B7ALH4_9EUPU
MIMILSKSFCTYYNIQFIYQAMSAMWRIIQGVFLGYHNLLLSQRALTFTSAFKYQNRRSLTCSPCVVDLRSDTVTKPTEKMREAMKNAVVGDDVYGEDPTVNKLQAVISEMLGKEAALLVPTCTMANTASVLVHCNGRFNEVILGEDSHMYLYEVAGIAQLAGIQGCSVPNLPDGTMDLDKIEAKIRPLDDDHQPFTRAICIENTHNRCGGKVLPLDYIQKVQALAQKYKLLLHLDGARIFNASVALKVPVSEIAQYFDSVSVAFTKGLCCPVGSIIAGTHDFINLARRARKAMGGGMRQAGVIAAPMLVALEDMIPRLSEDHERAFRIAKAVNTRLGNPICRVDMDGVQSNIVMIQFDGDITPSQFSQRLQKVTDKERKSLGQSISVLMSPYSPTTLRYVTHNNINDSDVEKVIRKFYYVLEEMLIR